MLTARLARGAVLGTPVRPRLLQAARLGAYGTIALVGLAVLVLAYAFVSHDFRIAYVAHYSDRSMPTPFLLTALWGGQDGSLLWWLFQRNYLDARRSETLVLTDRELIVDRQGPDGEREEHRLDAYWLKIEQGERLVVTSRGNRVVIGRFLAPAVRNEVGEQLEAALARLRSPRYEHPWDRKEQA